MICVVVRQTTDWENEAVVQAQLPDGFRPAVALWNATFEMPYHVFRCELTRIARLSLSRVEGIVCVPRDHVPPGALVVPTDDDDWFAPVLGTALQAAADDRHLGYYWRSAFLEVPISLAHELGLVRRAVFPWTPPKWLCTTNNYAVAMRRDAAPLIDSHVKASRWFVGNRALVKRLDEHLSVMNRSLASQTSFRSVHSQAALIRKYGRYVTLYRRPLRPELQWSAPYVAMMRDLMDDLRVRRR